MLFSGAVLFCPSRTFIFCQFNEHVRFHVVQPKNWDDHSLEQGWYPQFMFRKTPESCGICSSNMLCFGVFFLELSILREFSFQTLPRSSKLRYFNFLCPPSPAYKKIRVVSLVSFPNFPPQNAHQERVNTLTAASRFIAGGKSGCYLDLPFCV